MAIDKISLNSSKLGEARFPQDLFMVPQSGQITSARITQKRDTENNPIPGSYAKIPFELVNFKTLQTIVKDGGDISDLATISAEFITEESVLRMHKPEELIGKLLDLQDAKVALRWVSRGSSGSYGGYKLVFDNLKFINPPAIKGNE